MTDKRAYDRKLKELMAGVGKLKNEEVRRVMVLLEDLHREIASRVAVSEWDAHHLIEMKRTIAAAVKAFRARYTAASESALASMWEAGMESVDLPLTVAGVSIAAPTIPRAALEIMQDYSADLIRGLTADALKQVNNEITLGVLGGKTPYQAMEAIGRTIDAGRFKSLSYRAEMITRTEMARVNSAAREARMQAVAGKTDPPMRYMKKWVSSGKRHPRPHHARLDGTVIGLDEKFLGRIPYPHAPGLPASETINCGCTHVLYSPDWRK